MAAALEPSPRASGIGFDILDPPPDALERPEAQLREPGLERHDEAVRPILGQLADAIALDGQVDRLTGQPRASVASTLTRSGRSTASPRQS